MLRVLGGEVAVINVGRMRSKVMIPSSLLSWVVADVSLQLFA